MNPWLWELPGLLYPYRGAGYDNWSMMPTPLGVGGWTAATLAANVDAWLAASSVVPEYALVGIGTNDLIFASTQASYETGLAYVLDAVHAKWPGAVILVSRPWARGYDAAADTLSGWIDNVLASRGWATVSDDERVWAKGADNGATMMQDYAHWSAAGHHEKANQMKAAMGY